MSVIRFNAFTLDTEQFQLLKDTESLEIEPQILEVLIVLIDNHQRVVSKDELLDRVWQGKVVTENVITRTIYELRKILNDDPKKPDIIRTIRGKGYQFVAPLVCVPTNNTTLFSKFSHRAYVLAALTVLLVSGLFVGLSWHKQPFTATVDHTQKHNIVAILPLTLSSQSPELSILAHSITDYLSHQLASNLQTTVLNPGKLLSLKQHFNDIRAIQKATNAHFIIEGFVEVVSEHSIKVHMTLNKRTDNNDLIPFALGAITLPFPQTSEDLMDLYRQRKATLYGIINLIKPGITFKDNGEVETNDPEAYRMVIAAHHIQANNYCQMNDRAEELLLSALDRDPGFAYAWSKLFYNYYRRTWSCGQSTDYSLKALEVADRLETLAPNKYHNVIIDRNGILIELNRVEEAYQYMLDNTNPDNINSHYRQAYALRYAGFLQYASEKIDHILRIDPLYFSSSPIVKVPNTLLYQNKFAQHLTTLAPIGNNYHDFYRALNVQLSGQKIAAMGILKEIIDRDKKDVFTLFAKALNAAINDEPETVKKLLFGIIDKRQQQNHKDGEFTYKQAQIFALSGQVDLAIDNLQRCVDEGFFPAKYFMHDPALQSIRDDPRFDLIVDQAIQRHRRFANQFGLTAEI